MRSVCAVVKGTVSAYQICVTASRMVAASPERLFAFLDDPMHIGAQMQRRNWLTAGMRMEHDLAVRAL